MNKRKSQEHLEEVKRSRAPLMVRVIAIYFSTLLVFIFLVIEFSVPLYEANGQPTAWLGGIFFLYYFLPISVAVLFGLAFRPFWANFRNTLTAVLLIQAVYSLIVYAVRYTHVQTLEEGIHEIRQAQVNLRRFDHRTLDQNQNGLIDGVEFSIEFESGDLPSGEYEAHAFLSQDGQALPDGKISSHGFRVAPKIKKVVSGKFDFDPQPFKEYFKRGEVVVNLAFDRIVTLDEKTSRLLAFARWAPFFRSTFWDGRDTEIRPRIIEVETLSRVDVLSLDAIE
jgi:hypothetical protein